jgi:hypothetical protein
MKKLLISIIILVLLRNYFDDCVLLYNSDNTYMNGWWNYDHCICNGRYIPTDTTTCWFESYRLAGNLYERHGLSWLPVYIESEIPDLDTICRDPPWFTKLTTDHLLSMRYQTYCDYPVHDKSFVSEFEGQKRYDINHQLLREELATRPHRVRAKDRRKK